MKFRIIVVTLALTFIAFAAYAAQVNTSGRCPSGQSCEVGTSTTTSYIVTTDGGTVTSDGTLTTTGAITSGGAVAVTGAITATGDVTISTDATGGDAGAVNQFIGVPRIKLVSSATDESIDGTGAAFALMDDSPIGEAAPITGGTEAAETTIFRVGAGSYKYTWAATVAANHGIDFTVTGHANAGTDSLGFWLRSDTTFLSGDLDATLDDGSSAEGNAVVPAYATANVWQWMEVDFASDCDATCADVDGVFIQASAQSPTTFNGAVMYIDAGAAWIDTAEIDLNLAIQYDGVLGVVASPDAEAGEQDFVPLVEWTSYFPHYESGSDFLVALDDQSANTWMILVAY